jgi:hypothetical protein
MNLGKFSFLTVMLWACFTAASAQVGAGDVYPDWTAGYLDIHHISTGKGECMFAILPDGTTMMIDAGETGTDKRNFKPDGSRSFRGVDIPVHPSHDASVAGEKTGLYAPHSFS